MWRFVKSMVIVGTLDTLLQAEGCTYAEWLQTGLGNVVSNVVEAGLLSLLF